jgi:UDP-2-acetamido-3-amino-2,3-dideoxy-glucuronate N-acetyltransferase
MRHVLLDVNVVVDLCVEPGGSANSRLSKPVFVDIEPYTCNIDATLIEAKNTDRAKAIMPLSLYGQPAYMDAIIDDGAQIGEGSCIWHWVHVCGAARIGQGVSLGQNVFVGNKVSIGDRCKIQNNVSVYDNVTQEEGVYNPRSLIERKSEYRDTLVKRRATLGANCTIVCGVTIGEFAFIGAGAVINEDVKPYALIVGVPARQIGWMSEHGEQIPLPLEGEGSYTCPHSGQTDRLQNDQIICVH